MIFVSEHQVVHQWACWFCGAQEHEDAMIVKAGSRGLENLSFKLTEATYLRRYASVLGIVAKHADAAALGELVILVVEVLSHTDALHHGPGLARPKEGRWKDDCVEWDVVLAHKLDHVHIIWILPPCLRIDGHFLRCCWSTAQIKRPQVKCVRAPVLTWIMPNPSVKCTTRLQDLHGDPPSTGPSFPK